jgi:hypothetical protein
MMTLDVEVFDLDNAVEDPELLTEDGESDFDKLWEDKIDGGVKCQCVNG